MPSTREVEKSWNLQKFDLWPAITGSNIDLGPKIIPPIASTRREQSAGLFREALRRFVWKRQGGGGRTNPPSTPAKVANHRLRARVKDGTVPYRSTIIYLIVEYLIGWCVSISHKSFSGRKKHVRTAEKARLIRTFVNDDPMKSHRRCGAPWAAWASLLPFCWKMTQGRCTNCTILLQKDVSPFMQQLWPSNGCEAVRGAVHRQRHLRHVVTEVSVPYPTSFPPMGSCEGRDLQAWTPRPPRVKTHGCGVC